LKKQDETPPNDELLLRQEINRIDILFRQNSNALGVQLLYTIPYCYVSWRVSSHIFLLCWATLYLATGVVRAYLSWDWRKHVAELTSLREAQHRLVVLQVMILLGGLCWSPIAWYFPQASSMQQLLTAMSMIFMCAGAICLYAGSLLTPWLLTVPTFLPWIVAMFLSRNSDLHLLAAMATCYFAVGVMVAVSLHRYVSDSLRTTVEFAEAREELRESKEDLVMALHSSGARTWSWDLETKTLCAEGDLSGLGLGDSSICGTEQQYATLLDPSLRHELRERFLSAVEINGEIETEHLLQIPGHGPIYLAIRGKATRDDDGKIVAFKGICWDATGKRTEETLRHERDVQEAANKAKSVFLANASHEMRTPLAAISGYTEALLDSTLPPQIRQDLQVVQRTGKYLTSLVNDFLDLSRIETGQLYIQKNAVSPEKEITEVLQIIKPTLDGKNLTLALEVITLLPETIETDQTRLRQILINMLSNAAKYTESGEVRVRVSYDLKQNGKAHLSVRVIDTGVGITEQVRQNLFRPFARGETAFIKRTEGAGLGLALSRSLARALGGDLQLIRSSPMQGSEFEFTLNLDSEPAIEFKIVEQIKDTYVQSVSRLPLDGISILVAEDSEDLRELMERVLQSKGAKINSCGDGAEAVKLALNTHYDVILMDINMPVMDGYQATASLRARGYAGPVIALTAHASIEHRQMSLEAGCDAYLSKPVNAKSLVEVLGKCVKHARAEKRHQIGVEV
jgi:signal transduction histidine kinase/ActR/RegA family two-component response regulator